MNKLRYKLSTAGRNMAWHIGLNRSYFTKARGARILVYHGICMKDHLRYNTLFIKLNTFEAHLRLYKEYFNIISLDDFYQQRFAEGRFNVCLTFDDGFANNYKYVLPLLEQYEVPATFFITGIRDAGYNILWNDVLNMAYQHGPEKFNFKEEEFIKGKYKRYVSVSTGQRLGDILRSTGFENKTLMIEALDSYKNKAEKDFWLQMSEEEIKLLSASKWVTIGSHSYYHNDLTKISASLVKSDMIKTKQFLENITGKDVKALAFPYGSYTKETLEIAKNAGHSQLLTTGFLFPDDINNAMMRDRLTINPFISHINQMHANITGHYA